MPKLSDTMQEGVIAKWNVKEGDTVASGDIIAEVETDKATMDVEVYDAGTVLKIMAKQGESVALGGIMAIIGKPGEDISALLGGAASSATPTATPSSTPSSTPASSTPANATSVSPAAATPAASFDPILGNLASGTVAVEASSRIKASPLARKIATEQGIDLTRVQGSGPDGRIVKRDVASGQAAAMPKAAATATLPVFTAPSAADEDIRITQMRKTIARRLAESKFTSPHFYETIDIDMKQAIIAREQLNAISDVKLSFNDMVVKACAVALRRHPKVNASWLEDVIRINGSVHIAVAVAVEDGLLTPVIRHADQKGLRQISIETKDLATRARDKKLQPEDWEGSTFTISNLGMYGIEEFTAIINPPNAAILAVGAIRDVPVVENDTVVPGKRMKVTLSSDHRVVDGATVAQFLSTLKQLLEHPSSMLL